MIIALLIFIYPVDLQSENIVNSNNNTNLPNSVQHNVNDPPQNSIHKVPFLSAWEFWASVLILLFGLSVQPFQGGFKLSLKVI